MESVSEIFGEEALRSTSLSLTMGYSNKRRFGLAFDEKAAMAHLIDDSELAADQQADLHQAASWADLRKALASLDASEEVKALRTSVEAVYEHGGAYYAFNEILSKNVPEFLYFDEYYQMEGHENIPTLIARKKSKTLRPSDHPLLGLINLARLKLEDLLNAQRTSDLVNRLEGAGNHLTRQVLKYWSQNKHLQMKFDIREGRPQDPEHMRSGQNIWGKVYDQVHWATTELGSRSRGFVWFFSFLAWYEDVKRSNKNLVLLLDEPGLSLHGRAQADLLRYIETELKPHHQVIYTTHSPFMVDTDRFDRVRIVQDNSIDADEPLPKDKDGTKVITDVFEASEDSLFPLQGALGYDLHQSLFVGPNSLIVEGAADLLYLQGMSSVLSRDGRVSLDERWVITPVGGSGKVSTFVSLLGSQKGMKIAVLLDVQDSERDMVEALYKKKLLNRKNVHTYADCLANFEADVEDMFDRDFYLKLVNSEYAKQLAGKLTASKVNPRVPRVVKAIEAHLASSPLKAGQFGHFRPARYFSENLNVLTPSISDDTKQRFEDLFGKLNALL